MGRLIPFILLILILLGVLIGVPLLLQPDSHRAQLADYLSQKLGHKVVIAKLDAGLFPPALRLHDVTVMRNSDPSPILRVERVDVTPDWQSLLKAKFLPGALVFNRWLLDIRRRENGTWDWDEWLTPFTQASTSGAWPLAGVAVHQGECHWVDNFAAEPQELVLQSVDGLFDRGKQQMKFAGILASAAGPLAVEWNGQGSFLSGAAWSGDLKLTDQSRPWTLHVEDQNHVIDAKGQAAEWRAGQLWSLLSFYCRWKTVAGAASGAAPNESGLLKDWKNHFTWNPSSMTFYEAGTLGGGLTELKGDEQFAADHLNVTLAISLQDVPASEIAGALGESLPVDGKLTTASRLEFPVAARPWSDLSGQGTLKVRDGHFRLSEATLHSLSKAHTLAYFKSKYPDFAESGLPVKNLHGRFDAHQGIINVESAVLDAGDVKAALAGRLDGVRRGVDAYVRLQIHEASPDLIREIPGHYIWGAPGHEQIQPIYGHIQGTWTEWHLRAATSASLPESIAGRLRTALAQ